MDGFAEVPACDAPARRRQGVQRSYHRLAQQHGQQRHRHRERAEHRHQHAVTPGADLIELGDTVAAGLLEAVVLDVEKGSQTVEFSFSERTGLIGDDVDVTRPDRTDQRLGKRCAPGAGGLLDGIEILEQVRTVLLEDPDVCRRLLLDQPALVVWGQELRIGGDEVPAHRRLLIAQRALQLVGSDPRGLNVRDELPGHLLGAIEQHRHGEPAGQHHHAHHRQHEVLPALNGQLRCPYPAP